MWDIGPNVSCILVKRSEIEVIFIRAARRACSKCDPEAHRYPCGRTQEHRGTGCNAKTITERICGCLVGFDAYILCSR